MKVKFLKMARKRFKWKHVGNNEWLILNIKDQISVSRYSVNDTMSYMVTKLLGFSSMMNRLELKNERAMKKEYYQDLKTF